MVTKQVSVPPVALAVGGVIFSVTDAVALAVQPLAVLVTVTVYTPGVSTTGLCTVDVNPPGPVQLYVGDGAFVVTEIVSIVTVQVSNPPVVVALGGWILLVTVVEAVAVQPFVLLVTFNVYVPAALTMGISVVAPETILPPAEAVHK